MSDFELATRAVPARGEALHGYLDRTSQALGTPLGAVLRYLHLPVRNVLGCRATCALDPDVAADLDDALELPRGSAEAMTLKGALPTLLPSLAAGTDHMDVNRAAARDWFFVGGSRYCVLCLRETGIWQLRWQLHLNVACVRHGVLLTDHCPACHAFPRSAGTKRKAGHATAWELAIREPTTCYAPGRRPEARRGLASEPCGASLVGRAADPSSAAVSRYQRLVNDALDGRRVQIAGTSHDPYRALVAMRELVCLSTRLSTHKGDTSRRRLWRTPPQSVTQVTTQIEATEAAWAAATPIDAGKVLRDLARKHGITLNKNFFRDALGSHHVLEPAYTEALIGTGRVSTRLRRSGRDNPQDGATFSVDSVPQLVWPCAIPELLANRTGRPSQTMLRAVFSLALARLQAGTWEAAADALGYRADVGRQWSRYVIGQLDPHERELLFSATLDVAKQLRTLEHPYNFALNRHPVAKAAHLKYAQQAPCSQVDGWCPCAGSHAVSSG